MASSDSSSHSGSPEPLLRPTRPARPSRLGELLGRATGRRGPSMLVRETAAQQLERRRAYWAHSRPVVALDMAWNIAFAALAVAVLCATGDERPVTPVRVWIAGYGIQCLVHVGFVWTEFRRRGRRPRTRLGTEEGSSPIESEEGESDFEEEIEQNSYVKKCESLNTMVSFFWWVMGFYWIVSGGDELLQNAPRLYWVSVVFLAFDVFFAVFCVALACFIGMALCCCLPCVIALLYAFAGQEGASDTDISVLPRYKYSESSSEEKSTEEGIMVPVFNNSGTSTSERILLREDAECCICLTSYEDGSELCALPCNHHFHSTCIVKWLRIHATCPLCKYNILKGSDSS
ncbi:hypothetical protein LUZ60_000238 [Juncus effusus]|nr:hypothetical protein LUZ60_000238 [Juncus effusus]